MSETACVICFLRDSACIPRRQRIVQMSRKRKVV